MRTLIAGLLLALLASPAGAENLLKNPSFEEAREGRIAAWAGTGHTWYEEPKGSGLAEAAPDNAVVQGAGQRSLKVAGRGNRGMVQQVLPYRAAWGRKMRLSGWIRIAEIRPACARLSVEFIGEGDKWLGLAGVVTDWRKSTMDWERFEREFEVPAGTRYLSVSCNTDKATRGTAWFDNLALEPLAPPAPAAAEPGTAPAAAGSSKPAPGAGQPGAGAAGTAQPGATPAAAEAGKPGAGAAGTAQPGATSAAVGAAKPGAAPAGAAPAKPGAAPTASAPAREAEALVPIDTFEGEGVAWHANAWGGSTPARFSLRGDGAPAGRQYLRVECASAKANMVDRHWNYDGKWDALSFHIRGVSGGGGLTLYYVCGGVYFHARWLAPAREWRKVSIFHDEVRYAWGAKDEEDKTFDPTRLTKLSFGHDEVVTFDLDEVAVDVRDALAVRAAFTNTRANLFRPGDRPVVKAEVLNAFADAQSATLEVELLDYNGKSRGRQARALTLAPRVFATEAVTLPALGRGFSTARVRLIQRGRVAGERSVGLCALPSPSRAGKAFMGASGFGMGADSADIGHKIGVRAAEFFVSWEDCEPARGQYELARFASALDAFEKYGFDVTGMLLLRPDDVPDWANASATPEERDRHFARDPADFARFMEALVGRYKGRVRRWSFCCEVDLAAHRWARGFDGYVEMVRAGCEGAKRADPGCTIGGIGVSGVDCTRNPRFPVLKQLWAKLSDCLDGVFIDAYADPRYFGPGLPVAGPEQNDDAGMLAEAARIARERGPKQRRAPEDTGWAIDDRLPVDAPLAREMAEVLARSFIVARAEDAVDHYMWFQMLTRWAEGGYSYSLFRVEGDHINPRPAVAAYAEVAHFLAGAEKPRRIPLHQDLYAYTFAAGKGSRAALWTVQPGTVSLEVALPKTALLTDVMGTPLGRGTGQTQGLRLSRSPVYVWDAGMPAGRLSATLAKGSFHLPCARLALSFPDTGHVRVHVRSQVSRPVKGRLTLKAPAGWGLPAPGQTVAVPAGGTAVATFAVAGGQGAGRRPGGARLPSDRSDASDPSDRPDRPGLPPGWPNAAGGTTAAPVLPLKPGAFSATLSTPEAGRVEGTAEPLLLPAAHLRGSPRIDGDLAEYAGLAPIRLNHQGFLSPPDAGANKMWTGVEDLSVTAWVAWDEARFYFAARVRDDAHVQERTGTAIWANDSFQIGFDTLSDALDPAFAGRAGYSPDDHEFGIALTPEGPQLFQWTGGPDPNGRLVPAAQLAIRRDGSETLYEWAVPWGELKPLAPRAGRIFGFSFVAIDADKSGQSAPYWMGLTHGICGGKNPAAFARCVLMPG